MTIAPWLLGLSLLAATQPATQQATQPPATPRPIVVRAAPSTERALVVDTRGDGDYVRADRLARALDATLETVAGRAGRAKLRLRGVTFELASDVGFVRAGGVDYPLVDAPEVEGDRLWLPVQFVTDVLPRAVSGLLFDAPLRELRAFAIVSTAPKRAPAATVPPAAPIAPPPSVSASTPAPRASATTRMRRSHVVVVDAGHGGPDSGMHGTPDGAPAIEEKQITLGVARRLRDALRVRGIEVVMTRTTDTLVALADRGRIANQQHGEVFISIHVNAANPAWRDPASVRGFETYFLADARSEEARQVAARENESVRFETAAPAGSRDPLGFILSDMAQNEHLRESSRLATFVQRSLGKAHPGPGHGVKQAGFKVLVTASMPAVLVEIGYGTNPADATFITSDAGQRALAAAIADAAVAYLGRAEQAGASQQVVP